MSDKDLKKIYSDGQTIYLDKDGNVVKIEYDQTPGGQEWAQFDKLTTKSE